MITIDLKDFISKVKLYQNSSYALESLYFTTLRHRDIWDNLSSLDVQDTRDIILKFLNAWKCRLSYTCASNLTKALQVSASDFVHLKPLSLDSLNSNLVFDNPELLHAFDTISTAKAVRRTVGATATSKILHMIKPNLFLMNDDNIRFGYGCSENGFGYLNFLWRAKLFGDTLINLYSISRGVSKADAFQKLVSECNSEATTLPKLIDEYNWVKYNP